MKERSWGNNGTPFRHNVVHMSKSAINGLCKVWLGAKEYDLVFEPLPCRTQDDMSAEEIAEIERAHGCYQQETPR
jgi:hypothetical protein